MTVRRARRWWLPLLLLALLVAACGEDPSADGPPEDDPAEEDPPPDDPPEDDPTEDDPADPPDDGEADEDGPLAAEIEQAISDAAERAGVSADEVEVVTAEEVTWSDGAMGCPEPGEMYTQALVEGYRIVVEAGGERLHYHGAEGDEPFYCDDPEDPQGAGEDR